LFKITKKQNESIPGRSNIEVEEVFYDGDMNNNVSIDQTNMQNNVNSAPSNKQKGEQLQVYEQVLEEAVHDSDTMYEKKSKAGHEAVPEAGIHKGVPVSGHANMHEAGQAENQNILYVLGHANVHKAVHDDSNESVYASDVSGSGHVDIHGGNEHILSHSTPKVYKKKANIRYPWCLIKLLKIPQS